MAQGLEPTLLATTSPRGLWVSQVQQPQCHPLSLPPHLETERAARVLWSHGGGCGGSRNCWDIWLGGLLTPSLWPWLLGICFYRPISEFFLIRDTSLIPNVLWFEYTVTRAEAR